MTPAPTPKPIALCQNDHPQYAPIDTRHRRSGVPVCACGALITFYYGSGTPLSAR